MAAVVVAMACTSVARRAELHLVDWMTLELRLQAIRKRRMASLISGASASARWIVCFAVLVVIVGAGLLNIR
jgi:hypothetical protein